jgi:drug/metabolite transporter (DMT)-like permease
MFKSTLSGQRVSMQTILSAIVMLAGVLVLTFSRYTNDKIMLYVGVLVTACGVLAGLVFTVLYGSIARHQRDSVRQ